MNIRYNSERASQLRSVNLQDHPKMKALRSEIKAFLSAASMVGHVFIVTAASHGFVPACRFWSQNISIFILISLRAKIPKYRQTIGKLSAKYQGALLQPPAPEKKKNLTICAPSPGPRKMLEKTSQSVPHPRHPRKSWKKPQRPVSGCIDPDIYMYFSILSRFSVSFEIYLTPFHTFS